MKTMKKILPALVALTILAACQSMETKEQAYPSMYDPNAKPVSMVVVPAINKSTAADAGDLIMATVAQPFADNGYYVVPIPLVAQIFNQEGISDGSELLNAPSSLFKKAFGADSVLYITIESWDTNYLVVAGNVTVGMSYQLRSTQDDELLWSYKATQVVDTSGSSSGFLLIDLIQTAVTTAMTDYLPVAYRANAMAVATMPYGKYHPLNGQDGDSKVVVKDLREASQGGGATTE